MKIEHVRAQPQMASVEAACRKFSATAIALVTFLALAIWMDGVPPTETLSKNFFTPYEARPAPAASYSSAGMPDSCEAVQRDIALRRSSNKSWRVEPPRLPNEGRVVIVTIASNPRYLGEIQNGWAQMEQFFLVPSNATLMLLYDITSMEPHVFNFAKKNGMGGHDVVWHLQTDLPSRGTDHSKARRF